MDEKNVFHSKFFAGIIIGLIAVVLLIASFSLGMMIGVHKAGYSYEYGQNYYRNFGGPVRGGAPGMMRGGDMMGRDLINAHGTYGEIIKIDAGTIVIQDQNNVEKTVLVGDKTVITQMHQTLKLSDLKVDEDVAVIGDPDTTGNIQARLIRVLPSPESLTPAPVTGAPTTQQ